MSYWYYPLGHNSKAPVTLKLSDTDLFLSSTSLQATITLLKEACPPGLDDAEFVGSLNSGRRKFRCWQRVNINGYPTGEKSFVLATQVTTIRCSLLHVFLILFYLEFPKNLWKSTKDIFLGEESLSLD